MQDRVVDSRDPVEVTVPEGRPALPPRISWGAVFAGGVVAITVGAMLNVLGLAVGATAVDPTPTAPPGDAEAFAVTGGVWLLVATLIGLTAGGYVAARLSGTTDKADSMLHGLSVWAVGYLISAVLLGNVVAGTVATATSAIGNLAGTLTQGVGSIVSSAVTETGPTPQAFVERVQDALRGRAPAQMTSEERNAEIARVLARAAIGGGELEQWQRERLTQLIATEYGLNAEQAAAGLEQAWAEVRQMVQEAERQALEAAEAAADAAAITAYWIFAAMLLGALAAVLGARIGTRNVVRVTRAEAAEARRYA